MGELLLEFKYIINFLSIYITYFIPVVSLRLRVTFCELQSHQFLCQTHFPFMRDFGKGF